MSEFNLSEKWKPVVGWEGVYSVSDKGRVRREKPGKGTNPGRIVLGWTDSKGYKRVILSFENTQEIKLVHRLVCEAFHGPAPEGKPLVLHWDDDPGNNQKDNLRWGDIQDNAIDRARNGKPFSNPNKEKTHCSQGHEFSDENTRRDKIGRRVCKACARERFQRVESIENNPDDPRHGTTNGYLNLKCRCSGCKSAHSDFQRKRPKRVNSDQGVPSRDDS